MKIFKVEWKEQVYEFPYEYEHSCIVCAEDKDQAKGVVLDNNPGAGKVKVKEVPTNHPYVICHHWTEVE